MVRDAAPWTVMCSYNRISRSTPRTGPVAAHRGSLRDSKRLRRAGRLGLGGAVDDPVARWLPASTSRCPRPAAQRPHHRRRRRAGALDEAVLNAAIARLLQLIERGDTPGLEAGNG
ncbi:MAG: hypothetical protein R2711_06725 [Acidimicrobiales bacterium]